MNLYLDALIVLVVCVIILFGVLYPIMRWVYKRVPTLFSALKIYDPKKDVFKKVNKQRQILYSFLFSFICSLVFMLWAYSDNESINMVIFLGLSSFVLTFILIIYFFKKRMIGI